MNKAYNAALEKLTPIGQTHLLQFWHKLSFEQQEQLSAQIEALDLALFEKQRQLLLDKGEQENHYSPLPDLNQKKDSLDESIGKQLIADGKVGCLILAGGQGTRLKFDGPKGMFPITTVKQKSLFQLFAEKTKAASRQAGVQLPIAIMTSPMNHQATIAFFEKNFFFGLDNNQVSFFQQTTLPILNRAGKLFLESPAKFAESPDGNGMALHHFYQSGIWKQWQQRGISILNLILVDNPLADPFDAFLFSAHKRQGNQITIKCSIRKDLKEKVGVLVIKEGKIAIVEYTELSESDRCAIDAQGAPLFKYANLSLFCFSMDYIEKLATSSFFIPLHKAFKEATSLNSKEMAWKFERFIFDILAHATKIGIVEYPRETCFAPLKNLHGENSPETVKMALQNRDYQIFSALTGTKQMIPPFEIAQDFYYPTSKVLAKWKGNQRVNSGYIEA